MSKPDSSSGERQIDYRHQSERGMQPAGDGIEFRPSAAGGSRATHGRAPWLAATLAMKVASVVSKTAGLSKKTAWADCPTRLPSIAGVVGREMIARIIPAE
jgi:hypothetical protein